MNINDKIVHLKVRVSNESSDIKKEKYFALIVFFIPLYITKKTSHCLDKPFTSIKHKILA